MKQRGAYWVYFAKNRWRRRKRRITKKWLRKAEVSVAKYVQMYIRATDEERKKDDGMIGGLMCARLSDLLADYLKLEQTWNDKERWIDGIINGQVKFSLSDKLTLKGEIVWGLRKDAGGRQWREPFMAELKLAKKKNKFISYILRFADEEPLSDKIVKTGSYPSIVSESWAIIFGGFKGSPKIPEIDFERKTDARCFKYIFVKNARV